MIHLRVQNDNLNFVYNLVPYPNVRITVPNDIFVDNGTTGPPGYGNLTIGDSLTLNCSFTTVRGISSPISFIWTTGDIELRREDYFTADVLNDTAIYTDLFTISSLSAIDNGRVYRCRVVINATRPVSNSDYFTVVFPGECKMFMHSHIVALGMFL